jgi:hypothetical protein
LRYQGSRAGAALRRRDAGMESSGAVPPSEGSPSRPGSRSGRTRLRGARSRSQWGERARMADRDRAEGPARLPVAARAKGASNARPKRPHPVCAAGPTSSRPAVLTRSLELVPARSRHDPAALRGRSRSGRRRAIPAASEPGFQRSRSRIGRARAELVRVGQREERGQQRQSGRIQGSASTARSTSSASTDGAMTPEEVRQPVRVGSPWALHPCPNAVA